MSKKMQLLIKTSTSDEAVEQFKYIYDSFLKKNEMFEKAEVRYDKLVGIPGDVISSTFWPLQIYTTNMQISVYCLSAGYGGSGPTDLKKILDMVGFKWTDRVLHSERNFVCFDFYK